MARIKLRILRRVKQMEEKNDMYLCKYNISKECKGAYKDCVDCVLENIKAEIKKYHVDSDWILRDSICGEV